MSEDHHNASPRSGMVYFAIAAVLALTAMTAQVSSGSKGLEDLAVCEAKSLNLGLASTPTH